MTVNEESDEFKILHPQTVAAKARKAAQDAISASFRAVDDDDGKEGRDSDASTDDDSDDGTPSIWPRCFCC